MAAFCDALNRTPLRLLFMLKELCNSSKPILKQTNETDHQMYGEDGLILLLIVGSLSPWLTFCHQYTVALLLLNTCFVKKTIYPASVKQAEKSTEKGECGLDRQDGGAPVGLATLLWFCVSFALVLARCTSLLIAYVFKKELCKLMVEIC